MIHKFRRIVKRYVTRKARVVNPGRQNLPDSRVILVHYGLGDTLLVMEVA